MESLLRWSIENSTGPGAQASTASQPVGSGSSGSTAVTSVNAAPRQHLDPSIIDHILGKSDGQLMKEALTVAVDRNRSDDERIQALDDFEMVSGFCCYLASSVLGTDFWLRCDSW